MSIIIRTTISANINHNTSTYMYICVYIMKTYFTFFLRIFTFPFSNENSDFDLFSSLRNTILFLFATIRNLNTSILFFSLGFFVFLLSPRSNCIFYTCGVKLRLLGPTSITQLEKLFSFFFCFCCCSLCHILIAVIVFCLLVAKRFVAHSRFYQCFT